jgi:ATP-dependent Clp protease ATP-binding subunit ClpA
MDKLTSRFRAALADAQSLAVGRDHQIIEPVHVMMALLSQEGGVTRPLLAQAGVDVNRLRSTLGEALDRLPHSRRSAHLERVEPAAERRRQAGAKAQRPVHLDRAVHPRGG